MLISKRRNFDNKDLLITFDNKSEGCYSIFFLEIFPIRFTYWENHGCSINFGCCYLPTCLGIVSCHFILLWGIASQSLRYGSRDGSPTYKVLVNPFTPYECPCVFDVQVLSVLRVWGIVLTPWECFVTSEAVAWCFGDTSGLLHIAFSLTLVRCYMKLAQDNLGVVW